MRKSLAGLLLAAIAAFTPLSASAQPVTVPSGLIPGEQYRLVFVTGATTNATSTNIVDYNNFVTADADSVPALAALGTTWTVIGSTAAVAAEDNTFTNPSTDPSYPIFNLTGDLFASSNSDLWSGFGDHAGVPIVSSSGALVARTIFSATTIFGLPNLPLGSPVVGLGNPDDAKADDWISDGETDSSLNPHSMYGLSGVLTVPTPEPSSLVLAAFGLAGLAAWGWRRRTRSA